jgi:glycosyltransferase involved in cell wall biosynthesis
MRLPFVSCIMPTANRQHFIPYAIDYFLNQNYQNTELIILDDGIKPAHSFISDNPRIQYRYSRTKKSIGSKRNLCCEEAKGDIIVHWDDDDWYAHDWISKQVTALITSGADITGLSNINYFSTVLNKKWKYRNTNPDNPWIYGATFAYWKSFWTSHRFKEMQAGEDNDFIWSSKATIYEHDYTEGYLGIVHTENIGIELYEDPREKIQITKWIKEINTSVTTEEVSKQISFLNTPLVTCIMPTANRPQFVPLAINNFLTQDYPNAELIIIDDGKEPIENLIPDDPRIHYFYFEPLGSIGTKRNIACEIANGELITHWDDDDWYAKDWISHQVRAIIDSKADISGIDQVQFYSPSLNSYWMTKNGNSKRPWLTGASLIYRKSFWQKYPFRDLQVGEDDDYVRNSGAKIFAHDYFQGFIATLHATNTSIKFFEDSKQVN